MIKRKALLLGYTGKDEADKKYHLSAVENDLKSYKNFLMSPKGGLWDFENENKNEKEIEIMIDEQLEGLSEKFLIYKNKLDFLYIVYSGHGYYKTCQHLGINKDNYTLTSECFKGWAPRQICVFDACAKIPKAESANEELIEDLRKHILTLKPDKRRDLREKYENQILQCPKQEIRLYATSPDEYAYASSKESYYISELLKELNSVEEDINIITAHEIAAKEVVKRSFEQQHPYHDVEPKNVIDYLPGAIDELF